MEVINSTAIPSNCYNHSYVYNGFGFSNQDYGAHLKVASSTSFGFNNHIQYEFPSFSSLSNDTSNESSDLQSSYNSTQVSGTYNSLKDSITTNSQNQIVYIKPYDPEEYSESYDDDDYYYESGQYQHNQQMKLPIQHQLQMQQSQQNINSRYSIMVQDGDEDDLEYGYQSKLDNDTYLNYYLNI